MPPLPANPSHLSRPSASSPRPIVSVPARSALPSRAPRSRTVLIASSDASLRQRLHQALGGLRWQVFEASCGAEAWAAASEAQSESQLEAVVVDLWLPDLAMEEFLGEFQQAYPQVDLLMVDGSLAEGSPRSGYHQELLYALRRSQATDTASWNLAPPLDAAEEGGAVERFAPITPFAGSKEWDSTLAPGKAAGQVSGDLEARPGLSQGSALPLSGTVVAADQGIGQGIDQGIDQRIDQAIDKGIGERKLRRREQSPVEPIPELVGASPSMLEVSRRIRLVAARSTPVLIEGPTGTGKERVAEALHRLSARSKKPFVAINCAAIPEALLEAELFGHTRGAFTGAVQGRTGRIESADGGTLFLDEIGEMPLALQAKLLRFVESGELQRVGDNETVKVDVRILAATHQPLAEDAQKGNFRADLYYRLAVFLIRTPALSEHMEDLPRLVEHFLAKLGERMPIKRIDPGAMARLAGHPWPGNVRELQHVLERATILAGDQATVTDEEIEFGLFG